MGAFRNRQAVIARRDESLTEAARRIRDFHVGTLIVVDDADGRRILVGVLTDRDLVVSVLARNGRDIDSLNVGDVMTAEPVTARGDENLLDALKKMRTFGVRRLPIVSDKGALEGILIFDDVIDLVAEELSDLTNLVAREQKREREARP